MTGVQTCALPISLAQPARLLVAKAAQRLGGAVRLAPREVVTRRLGHERRGEQQQARGRRREEQQPAPADGGRREREPREERLEQRARKAQAVQRLQGAAALRVVRALLELLQRLGEGRAGLQLPRAAHDRLVVGGRRRAAHAAVVGELVEQRDRACSRACWDGDVRSLAVAAGLGQILTLRLVVAVQAADGEPSQPCVAAVTEHP